MHSWIHASNIEVGDVIERNWKGWGTVRAVEECEVQDTTMLRVHFTDGSFEVYPFCKSVACNS